MHAPPPALFELPRYTPAPLFSHYAADLSHFARYAIYLFAPPSAAAVATAIRRSRHCGCRAATIATLAAPVAARRAPCR